MLSPGLMHRLTVQQAYCRVFGGSKTVSVFLLNRRVLPPRVPAHFACKLSLNEAAPQRMTIKEEEHQLKETQTTRVF